MDSSAPMRATGAHSHNLSFTYARAHTRRVCAREFVRVSLSTSLMHTHTYIHTHTDGLLPPVLLSLPLAPASPFIPGLTNSISPSAPSVHSQHRGSLLQMALCWTSLSSIFAL